MMSGKGHQFTSLPEHGIPVGCATANRDTSTPTELDKALIAERSQCAQHRVVVHTKYGSQIPRRWKTISRLRFAVAYGSSNLGCHLFMKGGRITWVNLRLEHDAIDSRSIILISQAR
jgi:hypothetical protein